MEKFYLFQHINRKKIKYSQESFFATCWEIPITFLSEDTNCICICSCHGDNSCTISDVEQGNCIAQHKLQNREDWLRPLRSPFIELHLWDFELGAVTRMDLPGKYNNLLLFFLQVKEVSFPRSPQPKLTRRNKTFTLCIVSKLKMYLELDSRQWSVLCVLLAVFHCLWRMSSDCQMACVNGCTTQFAAQNYIFFGLQKSTIPIIQLGSGSGVGQRLWKTDTITWLMWYCKTWQWNNRLWK